MKKICITVLLFGVCASMVSAQQHPSNNEEEDVTVTFGNNVPDNVNIYDVMVNNAPAQPQTSGVSRFAIVGNEGKFVLGIGGQVKGVMMVDFNNPLTNPNMFIVSSLTPKLPGNGALFQASAQQTNLFVNMVAMPGETNQIGVYAQAYFLGADYGLRLHQAYAKWRALKVGYAYGLFCDIAANPNTIDFEGPNVAATIPNVVFDVTVPITDKWQVAVGAELPLYSVSTSDNTEVAWSGVYSKTRTVTQRVPDMPLSVQYAWGKNVGHIRLTGMLRTLQYRDVNSGENRANLGWGVKLSGFAKTDGLVAYYQGVYGKGIASYMQDNTGLGLDMIPDQDKVGYMKNSESWGAMLALQYNWCKYVSSTVTYSMLRNYMNEYSGGYVAYGDQYKYGQYVQGNILWNVNNALTAGVEYLYGRKVNFDESKCCNNRLQAMLQLSF